MSRGYWLFFISAFGFIGIAIALGFLLQPKQPNLSSEQGFQEQSNAYYAGGSDCEPAKIRALAIRLRQSKADSCADTAEERRQAANNLIEARRSADAANAQAISAYQQTRIATWGGITGALTLIAAIAAAIFAERAAHHSKKQVDAIRAQISLLPSNFTLEAILNQFKVSGSSFPPSRPNVSLQFQNGGNSGGYIISIRAVHEIGVGPSDDPPFLQTPEIHFSDQTISANDVSEHQSVGLRNGAPTVADITQVQNGNFAVFFYGIIKYRDIFGEDHETTWCMRSEPDGTYRYWGGPTRNYRT